MALDFPSSPTNGQVFGNFYYDSSITAWRNLGSKNALSDSIKTVANSVGLTPVIPTSVTPVGAGSSASYDSVEGKITFATCTGITINGVFNSSYENYRILFSAQKNAVNSNVFVGFRVASAGTAVSTSTYNGGAAAWTTSDGSYQNLLLNATTSIPYVSRMIGNARYVSSSWDVYSPALARPTRLTGDGIGSVADIYEQILAIGGINLNATAYDGFNLFISGDNFSGTIQIYGYN
jgi:hypothetical protein